MIRCDPFKSPTESLCINLQQYVQYLSDVCVCRKALPSQSLELSVRPINYRSSCCRLKQVSDIS